MEVKEHRRFISALDAMSSMFSDPVTKTRQKLYWDLFLTRYPRVTIDEWEEACYRAMQEETFHKVPLPARLMDYVETSRNEDRRELYANGKRLQSHEITVEERERILKRDLEISARLSGLPSYTWLLTSKPEETA